MNFLKIMGRFIIYILFFIASWFVNLLAVFLIGFLFSDGSNETADNIHMICTIFLPIIASTLETIALKKKWAKKRLSQGEQIQTIEDLVSQQLDSLPEISTDCTSSIATKVHPVSVTLSGKNNSDNPAQIVQQKGKKVSVSIKRNHVESPKNETLKPMANEDDVYLRFGGVDAELLNIDLMEGHKFEQWCAAALKNIGFSHIEVTPPSGDHGVDILAEKGGIKYAVQCKRYNSDLSNKPVQEVHAGKDFYHCHVGAVITNRYFTQGAKDLAAATGTLLWDRDWIKSQLQASNSHQKNDTLLESIMDELFESKQASTAHIQRIFNLDYQYAEFVMKTLEEGEFVVQTNGGQYWAPNISEELWIAFKQSRDSTN